MTEMKSNGAGRLPDPELVERPARRRYSAEYKLRIVADADACERPGEIGALLRREGLYTSHLTYWRKQRDAGALEALGRPRGRKPTDRRDQGRSGAIYPLQTTCTRLKRRSRLAAARKRSRSPTGARG